jgi:hypothetical protein
MKRIIEIIIILSFIILPFKSFAVSNSISDKDLDRVCAQMGSITVKLGEYTIESQNLKNISTDGWNYWDPDHDRTNNIKDPHPNNAEGYFDGSSSTNPQKYPRGGSVGYFGYDEAYVTGGTVINSGAMTMEVVSTNDPNVSSQCKLEIVMLNSTIDSRIGVEAVLKLSNSPDLSGNQSLGRVYTEGIKSTTNGHLSVYAHNNSIQF